MNAEAAGRLAVFLLVARQKALLLPGAPSKSSSSSWSWSRNQKAESRNKRECGCDALQDKTSSDVFGPFLGDTSGLPRPGGEWAVDWWWPAAAAGLGTETSYHIWMLRYTRCF